MVALRRLLVVVATTTTTLVSAGTLIYNFTLSPSSAMLLWSPDFFDENTAGGLTNANPWAWNLTEYNKKKVRVGSIAECPCERVVEYAAWNNATYQWAPYAQTANITAAAVTLIGSAQGYKQATPIPTSHILPGQYSTTPGGSFFQSAVVSTSAGPQLASMQALNKQPSIYLVGLANDYYAGAMYIISAIILTYSLSIPGKDSPTASDLVLTTNQAVINGNFNPLLNCTGWSVSRSLASNTTTDTSEIDQLFVDTTALDASAATPTCYFPIPSNAVMVVVNGTAGPSSGSTFFEYQPDISQQKFSTFSSRFIVVDTTLHVAQFDTAPETLVITADAAHGHTSRINSITWYTAGAPASVVPGSSSSSPSSSSDTSRTNTQTDTGSSTVTAGGGGGSGSTPNSSSSSNTGPIVGGIVGGVAVIAVLGALIWWRRKKQTRPGPAHFGDIDTFDMTEGGLPMLDPYRDDVEGAGGIKGQDRRTEVERELDAGSVPPEGPLPPLYDPHWGATRASASASASGSTPAWAPVSPDQSAGAIYAQLGAPPVKAEHSSVVSRDNLVAASGTIEEKRPFRVTK